MRLTKSLLCGISALVLGAGPAFAGGDSTAGGSVLYPVEVTEYYLVIPQSPELG